MIGHFYYWARSADKLVERRIEDIDKPRRGDTVPRPDIALLNKETTDEVSDATMMRKHTNAWAQMIAKE